MAMKRPCYALLTSIHLLLASYSSTFAETAQQIVQKAFPSVVLVVVEDADHKSTGFGSGFFVTEKVIATNFHVIKGISGGYAQVVGKKEKYRLTGIVAVDEEQDLVLLSLDLLGVEGQNMHPLHLSDIPPQVGDSIYAIGNPLGLEGTISSGIISATRTFKDRSLLQITAPISEGSSGGPVIDLSGKVVGISASTFKEGQNLNLAVPVKYLAVLIPKISDPKPFISASTPIENLKPEEACRKSGNQKYDKGDYQSAIADFNQAISINPNYAEAYNNRGNAKSMKGDFDGAIADQNECIRLNPNYAPGYRNRGEMKYKKGDYDGDIADQNECIRISPNDAWGYYDRGEAKFKKLSYDAAIADFTDAIRISPRFSVAYAERGTVKFQKGDYDGDITDQNESLRLASSYSAYFYRGLARYKKSDYDGAIADYNESIRINSTCASAYLNRGNAKYAKGDYDGDIADQSEAIRVDPNYSIAYCNRGNAKVAKLDYDGAIADYTEAIRLNPNLTLAYTCRGNAKYKKGDLQGSTADYNEGKRVAALGQKNEQTVQNESQSSDSGSMLNSNSNYYICTIQIAAYDLKNPGKIVGYFKEGTHLKIESKDERPGFYRVSYSPNNEPPIEALCRSTDIGKIESSEPSERANASSRTITPQIDNTTEIIPLKDLPTKDGYPYGIKTKWPGLVKSPYAQDKSLVDVSKFTPNTSAKCPHTGKIFVVP